MIFLIVNIVWGHHKFPTQIKDLYLCRKYLHMEKKYTNAKKNLQNCAHQGYLLQHTETSVSFLQKYRHSNKKIYKSQYLRYCDGLSGAMSKCVSFTIIGIDYKSKNLRLRSYGLRQGVWISRFVGSLGGHNRPHQILMYWCELHLFTLTFTFCFEQKSGGT